MIKHKLISALLAGALCVLSAVPAGAAGEDAAPPAAEQAQDTGPAALNVRRMGLRAVASAVQENNPTVQALRKTASSMDVGGALTGAAGAGSPADLLQAQVESLENAMQELDPESDLYKTYAAQRDLLEAQAEDLTESLASTMTQGESAILQLQDAAYQVRRQADHIEGQLAQSAQTLLITIQNLSYSREQLELQLAALDRSIGAAETQLSLGMISQYQMELYRNQRDNLADTLDTLDDQSESLAGSLALLCGYDAGTAVMPSTLAPVYDSQLRAMSYESDLAEAKENSFTIWQARSTLRQAQTAYDKDIAGTGAAVESAQQTLEAAQQSVEAAFQGVFRNVSDCQTALKASQTAEQQAELDFRTSQAQYNLGMISKLNCQQAQDALENAKIAVEIAQLNLLSAYNQYEWAKQGVMTTTA